MDQMAAWPVKRRRILAGAAACIATLALAGLCGCGGGSTTTSEGFIIVPAGDTVIPAAGLSLVASPGAVSSGVKVTATPISGSDFASVQPFLPPGAPGLPNGTARVSNGAFALALIPPAPVLSGVITITISYDPTTVPAGFDPTSVRIYTLDHGAWTTLPFNTINNITATSSTVTGNISIGGANAFSDSGVYVVAASQAPPPPPLLKRL